MKKFQPAKSKSHFSTPKRETPRQRIIRLKEQIARLEDSWSLEGRPPSLCDFCCNFWHFGSGEDFDWGCEVRLEKFQQNDGFLLSCQEFAPVKNWELVVERWLVQYLYKSFWKREPYISNIAESEKKIEELTKLLNTRNQQIANQEQRFKDALQWRKERLAKLLPAEVMARMDGNSEDVVLGSEYARVENMNMSEKLNDQ